MKLRGTILASASHSTAVPRALRIIFWGRLRMPWRLPAKDAITLPEPEIRKRFFAPDLFFSLRSDKRSVGKEGYSKFISCWSPYHSTKQSKTSPLYSHYQSFYYTR